MFFVAAALVLVTAGVFAGNVKFASAIIYGFDGTNTIQLTQSATLVDLSKTGTGTIASVTGATANTYFLYADHAHTTPLYPVGF